MDSIEGTLKVSEVFMSIQGEGPQMGRRAVFVRLTACNLNCQWCDTTEVWRKGDRMPFDKILTPMQMLEIGTGAHLIITGGEPLLQQKNIPDFIDWIRTTLRVKLFVEIETNGTIVPDHEVKIRVNQWNCSPKTGNSGERQEKFLQPQAIKALAKLGAAFKFVVDKPEDMISIERNYSLLIPKNQIWLMPCAATLAQLNTKQQMVAWLAVKNGYNYTNRLHIQIWDKATGV